ncbi:ROK family protein [Agrococcus versicolor]|uniref:ROK family protein n=1 Tax=Agrococcus versicolor TaxID=501482 RepID=A0ABN3AP43_9MICO
MTHAVVPVLEIGGTHVTAALVDLDAHGVLAEHRGHPDAQGSAEAILSGWIDTARLLGDVAGDWVVAMPGPFDHDAGIGRFRDVGKFDSLDGVDVGAALREALGADVRFVNDADAYGLGEWFAGAAEGSSRAVLLTLGTGLGSAFVAEGAPIAAGADVPLDGEIHFESVRGLPVEDVVSRRALMAAGLAATGVERDVHELAIAARAGEKAAAAVLASGFSAVGEVIRPWLDRFGAEVLVIGGSMSRSWDLVEPAVIAGLDGWDGRLERAALGDTAPLLGAAWFGRGRRVV